MKHELTTDDKLLFESMKSKYISYNEENFFKNMQYKQEFEVTGLNDLLVSEYENDDEIYLVRECYEEYLIGHGIGTDGAEEVHVMSLSDALSVNLKNSGFLSKDMTVLEWLRDCDYSCVKYNRNHDLTR